jgi:hypothetical protein
MNQYRSGLRPVLAALAVFLLGARVAVADPLQFLSEATLTQVSSHGNDYVREGPGAATYLGPFMEVNDYTKHGDGYQGVATLTNANGDSLVLAWETEPVGPPRSSDRLCRGVPDHWGHGCVRRCDRVGHDDRPRQRGRHDRSSVRRDHCVLGPNGAVQAATAARSRLGEYRNGR